MVECHRFGDGLDTQFIMQQAATGIVLGEGGTALAVGGQHVHQVTVDFFMPRLNGEQLAGNKDACFGLLVLDSPFDLLGEEGNGRLPQSLSDACNPCLKFRCLGQVEAGEEIITVEIEL